MLSRIPGSACRSFLLFVLFVLFVVYGFALRLLRRRSIAAATFSCLLKIADPAVCSMLARYARERTEDTFGVYVGNEIEGEVRSLAKPAPSAPIHSGPIHSGQR